MSATPRSELTREELIRLHAAALPLQARLRHLPKAVKLEKQAWADVCRCHPEIERDGRRLHERDIAELPAVAQFSLWEEHRLKTWDEVGDALEPAKAAAFRIGHPLAAFADRLPDLEKPWIQAETLAAVEAVVREIEARLELARLFPPATGDDVASNAAADGAGGGLAAPASENEQAAPEAEEEPPMAPGPDFETFRWGAKTFEFPRPMQRRCLGVLWEARERGDRSVSVETLRDRVGSRETAKPADWFRNHPAWKTLVVARRQGQYSLEPPETPKL